MKSIAPRTPDYAAFVIGLKARIQSARISAARAVNRDLILLYWDIGRGIVEKQQQPVGVTASLRRWRQTCKKRSPV